MRIIGGVWRGSRVDFPEVPGLRPTPDRVRETLFNWLSPLLPGSRCLDLCAGAGALGLEALSRGADSVCFVDAAEASIVAINATLNRLPAAGEGTCVHADARTFLAAGPGGTSRPDIIFLDPPYDSGLVTPLLTALASEGWLTPGQRIYLEHETALPDGAVTLDGATLEPLRRGRAGRVQFGLWRVGFTAGGDAS